MDTLPTETLQRIFEFACTDGGYTGHSLSLVSQAIREIARTTRFHSVALAASPRRLQAFVRLYERECDPARGYKPRIQHLHVTFPRILRRDPRTIDGAWAPRRRSLSPPPRPSPSATPSSPSYRLRPILPSNSAGHATGDLVGTSAAMAPQHTPQREMQPPLQAEAVAAPPITSRTSRALPALPRRTSDTEGNVAPRLDDNPFHPPSGATSRDPTTSPEYRNAAQTLFRLVASDLVTLVVQSGFTSGGTLHLPIIDRPFPRLLEAAFVGMEYPHALLSDESDGTKTATTPLFPAVTHLYVAPWSSWELCLPFWSTNAPHVAYLSISHANNYINEIAGAMGVRVEPVRSQWGWDSDSDSEPGSPSSLVDPKAPLVPTYPSVRHLLLQPGPGPIGARCGGPWMGHHKTMQMLRQVERSCQAVGVKTVEVAAPKDNKFGVYYERARRGWLDRIDDGSDEAGFGGDMAVPLGMALG
ncbi:hypothetical protein VTO73DRAFT_1757 [Trametes versicolor]